MTSARARVRPILITAATTVLGMLPVAMGKSEYVSMIGAPFAVTVIGGTALSGGTISAVGFLFSGLLMALIRNGLIMVGVNVYFEATFLGVIILLAVMVEYFRLNVASRSRKL